MGADGLSKVLVLTTSRLTRLRETGFGWFVSEKLVGWVFGVLGKESARQMVRRIRAHEMCNKRGDRGSIIEAPRNLRSWHGGATDSVRLSERGGVETAFPNFLTKS